MERAKITYEERQIAKTLNYGTIFGGGADMVKTMLANLTNKDAQEFLYRFYRSYPGLRIALHLQ
nr:DNA polymerase [Candidatus Methanocrinis natronophilus]